MIEFDVAGRPVPFTRTGRKGRCRSCGSRDVTVASYSEPRYRNYRDVVAWEAKAAMAHDTHAMIEGPVRLHVVVAADAVSVAVVELTRGERFNRPRGDLDNYVKTIADGLQGIVYQNDVQVVALDAGFKIR